MKNTLATALFVLLLSPVLFGCTYTEQAGSVPSRPEMSEPAVSSGEETRTESGNGAGEDRASEEEENPYHLKLSVTDEGYDIFQPVSGLGQDYRYGPSILLRDDGSIDAFFSAPGDGNREYDWVTWQHSDDGGTTWSDEKVVLCPTPNSLDALSVCDPDVFYYEGYYYIGYTSTIDNTHNGFCNSVFIARSANPDGPYEKWNGSGWGGQPMPLIYYDGIGLGWGIGEPGFVIVDDTLYIYTTKSTYSKDLTMLRSTEVRTADITKEDWPEHLDYCGYAFIVSEDGSDGTEDYSYFDFDSWDVAYVEESGLFVSVCANRRFTSRSTILYFESTDGISFKRVSELNTNVFCGCHNCGIMGDALGHIKPGAPALIGYAYAGINNPEWGIWATRFAPLSITTVKDIDRSEDGKENIKSTITYRKNPGPLRQISVGADPLSSRRATGSGEYNIDYYWLDNGHGMHGINASEIRISDYDDTVISVNGGEIMPLSPGITSPTVEYEGFSRQITFCVVDNSEELYGNDAGKIDKFIPVASKYNVSASQPYAVAIRPMARLKNGNLCEFGNAELVKYGVTFTPEDETICLVGADGIISPVSVGETTVKIESSSGESYEVSVAVSD
ncbi:MAG: hypothetical protein K5985_01290 [Lachnospiraceae bacterium]|nr:hypothetical protein [Lachnospiraceae bacterium]